MPKPTKHRQTNHNNQQKIFHEHLLAILDYVDKSHAKGRTISVRKIKVILVKKCENCVNNEYIDLCLASSGQIGVLTINEAQQHITNKININSFVLYLNKDIVPDEKNFCFLSITHEVCLMEVTGGLYFP